MNEKEAEWNAGRLLEVSGSYWQTCALYAAVKLGVFTALDGAPATAERLAGRLETDARALAMLLNALTAMGLLSKEDETFTCTEAAVTFLSKASPAYLGHMITHHHHLMSGWEKLDRAIATGEAVQGRMSKTQEEQWRESFLMGMFNIAMGIAPQVAKDVDLSGRRRLMDLGGGPGTYAIHFCLTNPELEAKVLDLSTTEPFAERTIGRFKVGDRVGFESCDYLNDDIPGGFDAAWLSHILHGEGPEACKTIVRKAAAALESGGLFMVHEFVLNDTMDGPLFPALFSLNMLLATASGQAYSEAQISGFLAEAGLENIRRLNFSGPNDSAIIVGTAP